jgi:hypothetical protein
VETAARTARFVRSARILGYALAIGLHQGMNGSKGRHSALQTQREHQNESREPPIHSTEPTLSGPITANRALGFVRRVVVETGRS